MWKEFKEFALTGNLVDIAVGFVMGTAFAKVSGAFTGGIIAPVIGYLTGGIDLTKLKTVLKPAEIGADGKEAVAEVAIQWGLFLTAVLDFLVVAFVMFLIIKAIKAARRKQEVAPAPLPEPPADVALLTEIRDLLKNR